MALKRGLGKGLDSLIPTNVMMESEVKHATPPHQLRREKTAL